MMRGRSSTCLPACSPTFEQQASDAPEDTALVYEDVLELRHAEPAGNQLAHHLRWEGAGRGPLKDTLNHRALARVRR
jgi:hypothetical protein